MSLCSGQATHASEIRFDAQTSKRALTALRIHFLLRCRAPSVVYGLR